ncbi:hypothetical protein EOD40_11595 [Flavobacterium sufflavum]|uniref:Pr6Pr family membrane protein n=1 Tax=Flavobacterium sufflavum TaxID=1921138 RepID=A0A437KTC7_9FLAO|nr:Pr6Pr family membrane protein [Flavobacterium sufflavum]RVT75396.1 hypothetical protein EOD40_11595 [Flavobacterium sufflavum]
MKKVYEIIIFSLGWFSIVAQFVLIIQNRQADIPETILRFFSFFTILTNILVALFFTVKFFNLSRKSFGLFYKNGTFTALTTFILIVSLVYQVVLRSAWEPTGLQLVVDELLHTIIPLCTFICWFFYAEQSDSKIQSVIIWLFYPIIFIIFIFIRGYFSDFYPYPFLNISEIGFGNTLINTTLILILIVFIMSVLTLIGIKKNNSKTT